MIFTINHISKNYTGYEIQLFVKLVNEHFENAEHTIFPYENSERYFEHRAIYKESKVLQSACEPYFSINNVRTVASVFQSELSGIEFPEDEEMKYSEFIAKHSYSL